MLLVKDTPFEAGWFTWAIHPPAPSLVVVVKGTFDLVPRGTCTIASEQALLTGDEHAGGDPERELVYDSDFAVLKPRGETYLAGTCHAPRGAPASAVLVHFRVGAIRKELAILGDRFWKKSLLGGFTEPASFVSMPLAWSRSFGGSDENPVGRGIAPDPLDPEGRVPLPNIESPSALVRKAGDRPAPAGAFPIGKTWKARLAHGGHYDARWRMTRFPWFPSDFDYAYFNAAPRDQQIVGYWRGDEPIELANMHPRYPHLRAELPGIRPRAFLARTRGAALVEVPIVLDTIVVDADSMRVFCTWRGAKEVPGLDDSSFADVYVSAESIHTPRSKDEYDRGYAAALEAAAREEREHEAVPMPGGDVG